MDKREVRAILSAYREGETEDPRFVSAKAAAEADPELARWWAEQQELDRVISSKLMSAPVPVGLKTQLTAGEFRTVQRSSWSRRILLAAAAIVALAVMFSSWRGPFQPAVSLADYRDEMVSFIRLDPPLDVKSAEIARLTAFLKENGAPSQITFPKNLRQLNAAGCRRLRFRGHEVALLCFKQENGELVHLFVVDRKALAKSAGGSDAPAFAAEDDWMTATWVEGDHAYLLTTKGSRKTLERYLGTS